MRPIVSVLEPDFAATREYLFQKLHEERAGFWLCGLVTAGGQHRWTVREFLPVPDEANLARSGMSVSISPAFTAEVLQKCRVDGLSLFVLHSHPGARGYVNFSPTDDEGEPLFIAPVCRRLDDGVHGAIVFGEDSLSARWWDPEEFKPRPIEVVRVVGAFIRDLVPDNWADQVHDVDFTLAQYDRQVRAFGRDGQLRLSKLVVGVVGAGGTGSLTVQQLVRLGVGRILVVDDDRIDASNLPRTVAAIAEDAVLATPKVHVAARHGVGLLGSTQIEPLDGNIRNPAFAQRLRVCDVIFSCVDRHYPRAILNQFAQQYLTPVIDMGIQIQAGEGGRISGAGGRVAVIRPGAWCLSCTGDISPAQLRVEALSPEEREKEVEQGYVTPDIPAPSVISLNAVVSSLAVTEFLQLVLGFAGTSYGTGRRIYRILDGRVTEAADEPSDDCFVCRGRFKALGDRAVLP